LSTTIAKINKKIKNYKKVVQKTFIFIKKKIFVELKSSEKLPSFTIVTKYLLKQNFLDKIH
jgi:hypothetical protein